MASHQSLVGKASFIEYESVVHCKYLQPIYNHWLCYISNSNLAVIIAAIGCTYDIEEYSLRLNNVLDCAIYNQITVGNVTLTKAVLGTVKIFAVYEILRNPMNSFGIH